MAVLSDGMGLDCTVSCVASKLCPSLGPCSAVPSLPKISPTCTQQNVHISHAGPYIGFSLDPKARSNPHACSILHTWLIVDHHQDTQRNHWPPITWLKAYSSREQRRVWQQPGQDSAPLFQMVPSMWQTMVPHV